MVAQCKCESCTAIGWDVTYYADGDTTELTDGYVEGADRYEAMANFARENTGAVMVGLERKHT
jgi:hypothetical protein